MDKYEGCNKGESAVTATQKPKRKRMGLRGFLIKLGISAFIVVLFLCVRYLPMSWLEPVRRVLHDIFCFDFFGRTSFGGMPILAFFGL